MLVRDGIETWMIVEYEYMKLSYKQDPFANEEVPDIYRTRQPGKPSRFDSLYLLSIYRV